MLCQDNPCPGCPGRKSPCPLCVVNCAMLEECWRFVTSPGRSTLCGGGTRGEPSLFSPSRRHAQALSEIAGVARAGRSSAFQCVGGGSGGLKRVNYGDGGEDEVDDESIFSDSMITGMQGDWHVVGRAGMEAVGEEEEKERGRRKGARKDGTVSKPPVHSEIKIKGTLS